MDITNLTIEELKALGYDQMLLLQQTQQNLQLINQEITRKQSLVNEPNNII